MSLRLRGLAFAVLPLGLLFHCGESNSGQPGSDASMLAGDSGKPVADGGALVDGMASDASKSDEDAGTLPPACINSAQDSLDITSAPNAGEFGLSMTATSSATSWGELGNEAVILEVSAGTRFVGHLILHQGSTSFAYTMHLGALASGEKVHIQPSKLSSSKTPIKVCVTQTKLLSETDLPVMLPRAPIYIHPIAKRFDDVPLLVGWSKARSLFETVFTNENGGTAEICGGGAKGMQSEIARWGRSTDIETLYIYGTSPSWRRCTGSVPFTTGSPRLEAMHPYFYHGDGHNRVFENRTGYGATCGSATPERPDGALNGWGGTDINPANDSQYALTLRPLPVDLDPLGYAAASGRREGISDTYAPWMYRIASLELDREGKIDAAGQYVFPMNRYLYVDLHLGDVGGSGDSYCSIQHAGGFKLRVTTNTGITFDSPQMTADYAGAGNVWKRLAIVLPAAIVASDIKQFVFDAYDGDGIYLYEVGDAFIANADGPNGAKIDYVRKGNKTLNVYVDDDNGGCVAGVNMAPDGAKYPCTGTAYTFPK